MPRKDDFRHALQPLLTAVNHAAPDRIVQRAFVDLVHNLQSEGASHEAVLTAVVSRLLDGLQFGNWPGRGPSAPPATQGAAPL